jgi:UDP-N-acetylmuramoylalanine--D-glutamate ligase
VSTPLSFRKIAVLGLGKTGRALVEALAPRGFSLFLSEARRLTPEEKAFLRAHGVAWEDGGHSERVLEAELIVPSPGVPAHLRLLRQAPRVWSEIELAFRLAQPRTLIAVTGTNGKSTTCELIGAILRAVGLEPVVAGNIGRPAISTLAEASGKPWVLEVSSYQLEWTVRFRPQVAVWLNFSFDHLDHHQTLAHYFAAKARIFRNQREGDWAVLPPELLSRLSPRAQVRVYTEADLPSGWGEGLPQHLRADLSAAWAACSLAFPDLTSSPPPWREIEPSLRQPHRLEVVGTMGGITFIDDSKATNAHATRAALLALSQPVVLILGGRHKGGGYQLLRPLLREKVRHCILIGESQDYFAALLSQWGVGYERATTPLEALRRAYARARPGDVVLLSPACASFDQFENYAHRGRAFREAFGQLSRKIPPPVPDP